MNPMNPMTASKGFPDMSGTDPVGFMSGLQPPTGQIQDLKPGSIKTIPQYGGNGGSPFILYPNFPGPIKAIEVYSGVSDDPQRPYVIRGLRVEWFHSPTRPLYGRETDRKDTYTFRPDERILSMVIASGVRTDRIEFTTTHGNFRAGGNGGTAHVLDVASGIILGFQGRSGWDIDSLGVEFFEG
ncbi:hypothetical protein N7540_002497 [Penicillium herquei]|nr:hypothetical protein N7540_002497 [Penicillium herquei]